MGPTRSGGAWTHVEEVWIGLMGAQSVNLNQREETRNKPIINLFSWKWETMVVSDVICLSTGWFFRWVERVSWRTKWEWYGNGVVSKNSVNTWVLKVSQHIQNGKRLWKLFLGRPSQCIYSKFLEFFDPRLTHGILLWIFLSYLFFRVLGPFLRVLTPLLGFWPFVGREWK